MERSINQELPILNLPNIRGNNLQTDSLIITIMKRYVLIILIALALHYGSNAQTYMLEGVVISQTDSLPVVGATILVLNTSIYTATDTMGRFNIEVGLSKCSLRISAIGYSSVTTDVKLPAQSLTTIYLKEQRELITEVTISTGYQQITRERTVGSFSFIDTELFNQQVGSDVISRLEAIGNSISVNRNSTVSPQLMVRGLSTINGPGSPLVILDNFPYEGDLSNINPNDVENITILKDAAAASIWGTRAGNGVIVITTKKGKTNQPVTIDFNSNVKINMKPDFGYLSWINSSDFIELEKFLFEKGFYEQRINALNRPVLSPVVELLAQRASSGEDKEDIVDLRIDNMKSHDVRNDFLDYLYGIGISQQYALAIKGGSERMAWNVSTGYDHNKGSLGDLSSRFNLRFANVFEVSPRINLSTGLYLTQVQSVEGLPDWQELFIGGAGVYPYAQLADRQGTPLPIARDYRKSYLDTLGGGQLLDWSYYPLKDDNHKDAQNKLHSVITSLGLNFSPTKSLSFDIKYQYERQQGQSERYFGNESYFARDLFNRFTEIDNATGAITHNIPRGGIKDASTSLLNVHNLRGHMNVDKYMGRNKVFAMAGVEVRQAKTASNGHRLYGYDDDLLTFGSVDFITLFPQIITGSRARVPQGITTSSTVNRFVSFFGNATYSFDDRYTLYVSARSDASNLFGVKINNKWNPLWSIGGSWDIVKEDFFPWRNSVQFFKLRASYGYSGNADPSQTALATMVVGSLSPYTNTPTAWFRSYGNPQLKWEKVGTFNLGLDYRIANGRFYGSLEYFRKKSTDLFGYDPIDMTAGVGNTIVRNTATILAKGIDIETNAIVLSKKFNWTIQLNLNFYKDEVLKYHLSNQQGSNFVNTPFALVTGVEGKPVYALHSYPWAGLDPQTGDPRGFYNGEISTQYTDLMGSTVFIDDLVYHGPLLPTWLGSLGNSFGYKNLSLSFRFQYKLGHYFRKEALHYGNLFSNWHVNAEYTNRWQAPGDELLTNVPSMVYPINSARDNFYGGSEVNVVKADYIRLQYVSVNYQFRLLGASYLKDFSVYLNAENIGLLWKANSNDIDPEYRFSNTIVPPRTFALGIRASF